MLEQSRTMRRAVAFVLLAPIGVACGEDAPDRSGRSVFDPRSPLHGHLQAVSIVPIDPNEEGTFRTKCGFSHLNYDDPIVFPDQPGHAHLHMYVGNVDIDSDMTTRSIRSSSGTTCQGGPLNLTGYWTPAVLRPVGGGEYAIVYPVDTYVLDDNGVPVRDASGHPIENENRGPDVYYKRALAPVDTTVFPTGLRMIAGRASGTPDSPQGWGTAGGWSCHDVDMATYYDHIPPCAPNPDPSGEPHRLHLSIRFPQCWDGVSLDSPDHKSHMAFPSFAGNDTYACPATHPVWMPQVSFEFYFEITPENVGPDGTTSQWRLASDSYTVDADHPGGYSFHGDWFMAWNEEVMETFVEHCINDRRHCSNGDLGNGFALHGTTPGRGNAAGLEVIAGGLGAHAGH